MITNKFIDIVIQSARKKIIYTPHALDEMNKERELISTEDVRSVLFNGRIIEDSPEDKRGHSCLIAGFSNGDRCIHVVCAPKIEYLAIITTYVPDTEKWEPGFMSRRKK